MFKLLLQLAFGYLLKDILNGMILTPIRIRSIYFLPPPPSNQRVLITSCILYIMIMIDEIIILQKRSLSLHLSISNESSVLFLQLCSFIACNIICLRREIFMQPLRFVSSFI